MQTFLIGTSKFENDIHSICALKDKCKNIFPHYWKKEEKQTERNTKRERTKIKRERGRKKIKEEKNMTQVTKSKDQI